MFLDIYVLIANDEQTGLFLSFPCLVLPHLTLVRVDLLLTHEITLMTSFTFFLVLKALSLILLCLLLHQNEFVYTFLKRILRHIGLKVCVNLTNHTIKPRSFNLERFKGLVLRISLLLRKFY